MQAYPAEYPDAIRRSHRLALKCELSNVVAGVLATPTLLSGQVTLDRNAAVQRQLDCQLADPDGTIVPAGKTGLAAPYGNELKVWRGLVIDGRMYGQSTTYDFIVPLGVFRIASAVASDDGSYTVDVTAYDRSRTVSRNGFTSPYVIAAGSNYADAIGNLVKDRLPYLDPDDDFVIGTTDLTTPLIVLDVDADPWEEAAKMADSCGMECFFDGDGRFVLRDVVDPGDSDADWTYQEGEFSILTEVTKEATDDPGWNGVLLVSESTTLATPIRSLVWDDNPDSPTYYLGPYGQNPKKVTSPYVTTQAQGDLMARSILQAESGGTEQLTFAAVPNPVHELGDAVRLRRDKIRVDDVAIVEQMVIPLAATDPMTVTTRRRRALS